MSLHGHAKIELTNVKTGEVQTIEHDNIVTNAILNQLNYMYYNKDTINSEYLPLYDKVFNGILLFKEKNKPRDFKVETQSVVLARARA